MLVGKLVTSVYDIYYTTAYTICLYKSVDYICYQSNVEVEVLVRFKQDLHCTVL